MVFILLSMITRQQHASLLSAFEESANQYIKDHPHESLIHEWDAYLWSKAVLILRRKTPHDLIRWILFDCECIMETHMRDQMLMTIKRASPSVIEELGIETP